MSEDSKIGMIGTSMTPNYILSKALEMVPQVHSAVVLLQLKSGELVVSYSDMHVAQLCFLGKALDLTIDRELTQK